MKETTPVYIKTDDDMKWPQDKFFYLVAREGIFRCRNHEFFQSCVPIKDGPKELASQLKFVKASYPRIPRALIERTVGFFHLVAKKQNTEAAVILAYNRTTKQVELIIPEQIGINSGVTSHNPHGYPMDLNNEIPPMPPGMSLIGDIHCHVEGGAYASGTDTHDEVHRPGIHLVVGHIDKEPPSWHCEIVQDGSRFEVEHLSMIMEGYNQRDTVSVPREWLDKVKHEAKTWGYTTASHGVYDDGGYGQTYFGKDLDKDPPKSDMEIINRIIDKFKRDGRRPAFEELRSKLFTGTKETTYKWCFDKTKKVLDSWYKKEKHERAA